MRGSFRWALIIAVAAPLGAAQEPSGSWGNGLVLEPNTYHDLMDGFMFLGPDHDPNAAVGQVYLDAYAIQRPLGEASTGTTGNPGVVYQVFAFFGVWKDCDQDGAIGFGLLDLVDYPVYLLPNDDVCPSATGGRYNDGTTVREFHWLTPEHPLEDDLSGLLPGEMASEGIVWADFGNPEDPYDPYATSPVRPEDAQGPAAPKRDPDILLRYHRGAALEQVSTLTRDLTGQYALSPGMIDPTHGLGQLLCQQGTCTGWWSEPFVVANPGAQTDEGGIVAGSGRSLRMTTYAYLDDSAIAHYDLSTPPSPMGTYGAEHCPTSSGIVNGWDCDWENWGAASDPVWDLLEGPANLPVVGAGYRLRDVDPFNMVSHANPLG